MTKESSINFQQGKSFLSSSEHADNLWDHLPPVQSVLRLKWLGQKANPWPLSSARVKNTLYFHNPLYPHCVVVNETWRQFYLIWSVCMLMSCAAYRTNCCVNNRRLITVSNNVLVHRQQWQNVIPVDEESPCGCCVCTTLSATSVTLDRGRSWEKIAVLSALGQCGLVDRQHYR